MGRKIQSPRGREAHPQPVQPGDQLPGRTSRRRFLAASAGMAGAAAAGIAPQAAAQEGAAVPPWMQTMGTPMRGYGTPSTFEEKVVRTAASGYATVTPGAGSSRTPLQSLEGTITPSGLHFERHHNGVPNIDPARHQLMIHGLVRKPLIFTMEALERYPMTSRISFLECAGNSGVNTTSTTAPQVTAQAIHGLVSCSEWTGVPLSLVLSEAGVETGADWLLAEGADAAVMSRSVPLSKALDDAMLALYQNGERLRPEQGYPVRLLLPGWEGNMNVKWLRRIKVTTGPTHTKDETSKYSDLIPGGKALQFTFEMGVKSVITRPSSAASCRGSGFHEVSGIAGRGAGRIRRVGSVGGRRSELEGRCPAGDRCSRRALTRFRLPWEWNGARAVLASRATDERGNVQPARAAWLRRWRTPARYHNHTIQAWEVAADGSIANAFV